METSLNSRFLSLSLFISFFSFLFLSFLFLSLFFLALFYFSSVEFFFRIRSLFNLSNFPEFQLTCHLFSSVSFLLLLIPTFVQHNMVNDVTRTEGEIEGEEEREEEERKRKRRNRKRRE